MTAKAVMCWAGLLSGTSVSILANVEHMHGPALAHALGASVPILMAFAVHLAERVSNRWARWIAWAVVGLTFFVGYQSTYTLVSRWGMSQFQAALFPLVPELVMIVALIGLAEELARKTGLSAEPQRTVRPIKVTAEPVPKTEPVRPVVAHALSQDKPKPVLISATDKPATVRTPVRRDDSERLSAAREIADKLGDGLSRPLLVAGLKERGFTIGSDAAAELTRTLKVERTKTRS